MQEFETAKFYLWEASRYTLWYVIKNAAWVFGPGFLLLLILGYRSFHRYNWPSLSSKMALGRQSPAMVGEVILPIPSVTNPSNPSLGESISIINKEPGIHFGGLNVGLVEGNVVVWATITLVDKKGRESYVDNITTRNFTIHESYDGKRREATAFNVVSEIKARAIQTVIVLDNSGSMDGDSGVRDTASRLLTKSTISKRAVTAFIDAVRDDGMMMAVLPFSGGRASEEDFLRSPDGDIWWTDSQSKELKAEIRSKQPRDATPLWGALSVALDQFHYLDDEMYKVIVCLTDGDSNSGKITFAQLLERAKKEYIPIYVLGYGEGDKFYEDKLVQLAADSGAGVQEVGSFIRIAPQNWDLVFKRIRKNISKLYQVSWHSQFRTEGAEVSVTLKLKCNLDGQDYEKDYDLRYIYHEARKKRK